MAVSRIPPVTVRTTATRALGWIANGLAGDGFTDGARARARRLAAGAEMPVEWFTLAPAWFARHEGDAEAEGWNAGEDGFPSPGRVAWDAWGGDAGRTWATKVRDIIATEAGDDSERSIAEAERVDHLDPELLDGMTVDSLEGPTWTPRQAAIYTAVESIRDTFGTFDAGTGPDGVHYVDGDANPFAAEGIACSGCAFYEGGGGCELLPETIRVDAAGVCKFWIIPADLIVSGPESADEGDAEPMLEEPADA